MGIAKDDLARSPFRQGLEFARVGHDVGLAANANLLQVLVEGLRVRPHEAEALSEVLHERAELGRVERQDLAGRVRSHGGRVAPLHPEDGLRRPGPLAEEVATMRMSVVVTHVARDGEVHLLGHLALSEKHVLADQGLLLYAPAAQLHEALLAEDSVLVEEGRAGEVWRVQLSVQLVVDVSWQESQYV